MMDPSKIRTTSVTELVSALHHALCSVMRIEFVQRTTDVERSRFFSALNDGMPAELAGVEVMLMTRHGETDSELALLIPEHLARFFVGRSITCYASVIVEKHSDGIFFTKNRYGHSSVMVPSLEGEVVLSHEPLITATFTTPRTKKARAQHEVSRRPELG